MQITGLSAGYTDSGTVGRRSELLAASAGNGSEQATQAAGGSNVTMGLLMGVVSQYDLNDITPRDFSQMLRELRDAGAITEAEYGDLAQIRLDMDAENLDPDDSIDLLDFYRKTVDRAREDDASNESLVFVAMRRRLEWLQKVAILQESPEAAGMNALV
jgi:hypothetical protein